MITSFRMGKNKQVLCKVCYKSMRSNNLTRHMKQHSKRDESNPLTNISVTNNVYKSTASTQRSEEENQIKDENNLKLNETKGGLKRKHDGTGEEYEALKKCLIKYKQEYEEKITIIILGCANTDTFPPILTLFLPILTCCQYWHILR